MLYAIEKHGAEWIIYAQGVAILRCDQADIALEVAQMAQERMQSPNPPSGKRYGGACLVFQPETEGAACDGVNGVAVSMRR